MAVKATPMIRLFTRKHLCVWQAAPSSANRPLSGGTSVHVGRPLARPDVNDATAAHISSTGGTFSISATFGCTLGFISSCEEGLLPRGLMLKSEPHQRPAAVFPSSLCYVYTVGFAILLIVWNGFNTVAAENVCVGREQGTTDANEDAVID